MYKYFSMATDYYNFATELVIEIVCFYIGVILFSVICLIPPLTFLLPYILPIVFLICMIMNISFIVRFIKGSQAELEQKYEEVQDSTSSIAYADYLAQLS